MICLDIFSVLRKRMLTIIVCVLGLIISILFNLTRQSLPQKPIGLVPSVTSVFYLILSICLRKNILKFNYKVLILALIFLSSKLLYFLAQKDFNVLEQTIFQQTKIIIMVLGASFYLNRRYKPYKYFAVFLIFLGMILSAVFEVKKNPNGNEKTIFSYIIAILSYSLTGVGILYFDKHIKQDFYFWDYLANYEQINFCLNLLFLIFEIFIFRHEVEFKRIFHYSVPIAAIECLPSISFNYILEDPAFRAFLLQLIRIQATIVVSILTKNEINTLDIYFVIIIYIGIIFFDFGNVIINYLKKKVNGLSN